MKTCASLFTGCGGWEWGARQLGIKPLWGVEFNADYGPVYEANFPGAHLHLGDVKKAKPAQFKAPDFLFCSPPCQGHSEARNTRGLENRGDEGVGIEVLKFAAAYVGKGTRILIENVPEYLDHEIFHEIMEGLEGMGYTTSAGVYDASDYGCPSDRPRMLAWACSKATVAETMRRSAQATPDWWPVIEDLVRREPPSELAGWQLENLIHVPPPSYPVIIVGGNATRWAEKGKPGRRVWRVAGRAAPAIVKAKSQSGARVLVEPNYAVKMTPRMAARLMGFSDDFWLPNEKGAALDVVGNAVPPPLAVAALKALGVR
ncbi:MAG: DNA cytosine methyltransferase [Elusimicrobiota bacterium]